MQKIKHLIEAGLLYLLFAAFRALPLDVASWFGGFIAKSIGPFLSAHKTAEKNLSMVFPDLSLSQKHQLLAAMWDNLGRVAAELPNLPGEALYRRVTVRGLERLPPTGKPIIFFSGHLGNWELAYPIAYQNGIPVTLIYRHANNPYVDAMIARLRASKASDMLPKGPRGAIKLGRAIKNGNSLAMLVDQKMNNGVSVPFFGHDAMTAPAIADLALRYDMPIIPVRIVRTHGCHFEANIYPALAFERTGNHEQDVLAIMTQINQILEGWIRETPEQWFWVHQRWPKG